MKNSISELDQREINSIAGGKNKVTVIEAVAVTSAVMGYAVIHYYAIDPIIGKATDYIRKCF